MAASKEYKFMFDRRFDGEGGDDETPSNSSFVRASLWGGKKVEEPSSIDGRTAQENDTPPLSEPPPPPPPPPPPTYSQEQLDSAIFRAKEEGLKEGEAKAQSSLSSELKGIETQLLGKLDGLAETFKADEKKREEKIISLCMTAVSKLFPVMNARYGLSEVKNFLTETVKELKNESKVIVRLSAAQLKPMEEHVQKEIKKTAFDGRIVFAADDALKPGDCVAEWDNGGVERKTDELLKEIEKLFSAYIKSSSPSSPGHKANS